MNGEGIPWDFTEDITPTHLDSTLVHRPQITVCEVGVLVIIRKRT